MNKKRLLLVVLLLVSLPCVYVGALIGWDRITSPRWPYDYVPERSIPQREIVFLEEKSTNTLGFINADGSGLEYIRFWEEGRTREQAIFTYPVIWSSDGEFFLWVDRRYPLIYRIKGNRLVGRVVGKITEAEIALAPDSTQAIVTGHYRLPRGEVIGGIFLVDLTGKSQPPIVLDSTKDIGWRFTDGNGVGEYHSEIFEIGLHPICGNLLVFRAYYYGAFSTGSPGAEEYNERLILYDLSTGVQTTLWNLRARYPSCSPDGRWIGYTGEDGLYLMRPDGSMRRKIETVQGFPTISWSPDGEWIVYHVCSEEATCEIYKMNVETGEKVKLVDRGVYPYWRQGNPSR